MMSSTISVFVITGGTGGHIFPAIAISEALRDKGIKPVFLCRNSRFEQDLMRDYQFEYYTLPASGFFGKNIINKLYFFVLLILNMLLFPRLLLKVKPKAIVATGGFTSIGPLLWAIILSIPFFLLEQNRVPGRTTKYFSRWAKEVFLGFPLIKPIKGKTFYSGNPLRPQFKNCQRQDDGKTILVLGGSQGAYFLALLGVELATIMPDLRFIIQTGKRNYSLVKGKIKSDNCQLIDFTNSMQELYRQATIVISRAGGIALSEISVFGIPSILIPFPFATDNHQQANAQFLAQYRATIILEQCRRSEISQDFVIKTKNLIESLLNQPERLKEMSVNAKRISKIDSAEVIAKRIKTYIYKN
ncbi:MAG: UDP-N-acetylglucosamine--N-acetylmuramyl-(pentapeptide) pyrophosphoryl-undecaprenol N-acetylglucosamine transferase [candidate division WOR-3 bacterium]|nr:UDP-N-acetylglucosamine--N-acetylmuramyl-(pentapeptide) pyrophosphoryl-undecaprenol N-acetylglucosamine transferase [candidate division WOR-3 bacterium]